MTEPWSAEHVVNAALACALIEARLPGLAPARVEPLGAGFDNTAYLVNGTWVFRFPRRQVALVLLRREVALLPAVAPRVPLPIPVPEHVGAPSESYPWPFAGYRLLPGRTACTLALSAEQRVAFAEPLARFLAALHAFPAGEAASLGAPGDELGRTDVRMRRERSRVALAELRQQGLVDDTALLDFERILDAMPEDVPHPPAVLLHGDLYARHLLVDASGHLAGVIDWGDVHLGHPAVDLSIAWGFLPARARGAFHRTYGQIDESTWRLARFRALYHALSVVRYARAINDSDLLREGGLALQHVRED